MSLGLILALCGCGLLMYTVLLLMLSGIQQRLDNQEQCLLVIMDVIDDDRVGEIKKKLLRNERIEWPDCDEPIIIPFSRTAHKSPKKT